MTDRSRHLTPTGRMRVLLVEDSAADARLVREMLRESSRAGEVDLAHADHLRQALARLAEEGFDAILLDLRLPDSEGIETFVRARERAPAAPIVVLTGLHDEELAVRAVREGAQDYLVKGRVDGQLLMHSLRYAVERQHAEEELRASEQRFRELAANVRDVFFSIDAAGGAAHYLSPAYERVFGRTPAEGCAGRGTWADPIHPEDRPAVLAAVRDAADPATKRELLFRVPHADGSVRWVRARLAPITAPDGRLLRTVGIATDITELRRTQEQLVTAQKLEAVGQMAGGIAHDFNNVLTVIAANAEILLQNDAIPVDARPDIQDIRDAAEQASALTRQLLAFARKQMLEPRVVDLNVLLGDLRRLLERLLGEDVTLRTERSDGAATIRADPGQIEQVIINLAINARDAMPNGGRLTISTDEVGPEVVSAEANAPARPGRYVRLRVADTGTGIAPDVLDRIFEPFFTTKSTGKGTGLGLSTAHGIVTQHGGHIVASSEPGRGTTFSVFLPHAGADAAPPAARSAHAALPRGTETILVVEDEGMVRAVMRRSLAGAGYHVLEAENGAKALASCEQHRAEIALIITDVVMPGMSGPDLAVEAVGLIPTLRVLFTSGYPDRKSNERERIPQAAYLAKPFTQAQLAHKVREVLDGPRPT